MLSKRLQYLHLTTKYPISNIGVVSARLSRVKPARHGRHNHHIITT